MADVSWCMRILFRKGLWCIIGGFIVLHAVFLVSVCLEYEIEFIGSTGEIHRYFRRILIRRTQQLQKLSFPEAQLHLRILPRLGRCTSYSAFSDLLSSSSGFRIVVWSSVGAYFESFLSLGP